MVNIESLSDHFKVLGFQQCFCPKIAKLSGCDGAQFADASLRHGKLHNHHKVCLTSG